MVDPFQTMPSSVCRTSGGSPGNQEGEDIGLKRCFDQTGFDVGLGWNGLFPSVHAHKEHPVFAPKRKVRSLQARKMQQDPFMLFFDRVDHAAMNFVMEDLTDRMWTDGFGQRQRLTVQHASDLAQRSHTHDFSVGEFKLTHIDTVQPFFEFFDSFQFLLAPLLQEGMSKLRGDPVDKATADGKVVFQKR